MEQALDELSELDLVKHLHEHCLMRKRNLDLARESVVGRMFEIDCLRESLEKRLRILEEREREFDAFRESKKRKLALEEEESSHKRETMLNGVRMKEDELDEQLVSVNEHIEWLGMAQAEVQSIRWRACTKLKEIEAQEQKLRSEKVLLAEKESKVILIIETLDGRVTAVEEREKEFNLFLEGKMRELDLKEGQLRLKWEEFVKQVKLADERFRKNEKVKHVAIERLELAEAAVEAMRAKMNERFKEIECRDNVAWENVAVSVKEADLIRESMEAELEDKTRELASKEEQLKTMSIRFANDAELKNKALIKQEKLANQLLERLETAKNNVEGLKKKVHERFKEVGVREKDINMVSDWVERKMDEVDSKAKELDEREKRLIVKEDVVQGKEMELEVEQNKVDSVRQLTEQRLEMLDAREKNLIYKENELQGKEMELEVQQKKVDSARQLNEKWSEKLDAREKNLNSVAEFTKQCFQDHLAKKRKLFIEKDLIEKTARDLQLKEECLEQAVRELEIKEKQIRSHIEELELKKLSTYILDAHVKNELDESADLKFIVTMDGKTLQMFLNDPEKDLESMGDEIFRVLHLSQDPAKLVLGAMVGFYPPHLREGDVEFNVRRTCITLLQQLVKMPQNVKPHVREEAIELATSWKSRMKASPENPSSLEVLGFLLLLAAYNLASYFDKDEISRFLVMVDQHREQPELHRVLGFRECTT